MNVTVADHVKQLNYFARSFGECMYDIEAQQRGTPVFYNVDFSLLCPVLFQKEWQGSKAMLTSVRDGMQRVLENSKGSEHFGLVVSGATIIEFLDQLNHMLRELQLKLPNLPGKYMFKEHSILEQSIKTSSDIKRDLGVLTASGLDQRVRGPVKRLLALLDNGTLRGIGDVIDKEQVRAATDSKLFDRFVVEHKTRRLGSDGRAVDDSLFHYKVDAANACLTLAVASDKRVRAPFVTPTPLNLEQCTTAEDTFARVDKTPLCSLNVERLKRGNLIPSELGFLKQAVTEAISLAESLSGQTTYDECPPHLLIRLARFYEWYVAPLSRGIQSGGEEMNADHYEEILAALSDRRRLQNVLDEAVQGIRDGAKQIELRSESFDLPYLDQFNFGADPVLRRIRKNLSTG